MDDNGIIFYCVLLKDVNQNECLSLIDKDILWWSSLISFKECVLSVLLNGEQKTKIIYSPNKKKTFSILCCLLGGTSKLATDSLMDSSNVNIILGRHRNLEEHTRRQNALL
jgi:hypothetical protein